MWPQNHLRTVNTGHESNKNHACLLEMGSSCSCSVWCPVSASSTLSYGKVSFHFTFGCFNGKISSSGKLLCTSTSVFFSFDSILTRPNNQQPCFLATEKHRCPLIWKALLRSGKPESQLQSVCSTTYTHVDPVWTCLSFRCIRKCLIPTEMHLVHLDGGFSHTAFLPSLCCHGNEPLKTVCPVPAHEQRPPGHVIKLSTLSSWFYTCMKGLIRRVFEHARRSLVSKLDCQRSSW